MYAASALFKKNICRTFEFVYKLSGDKKKTILFLYKTIFHGMEAASIFILGESMLQTFKKKTGKMCQENTFPIKGFLYQRVQFLK